MDRIGNRRRSILISLLLSVVTLAVFWPVLNHGFIRLDDHQYVLDNLSVTTGLTWENIKWSFQAGYAGNWHPLTWLSHMLDVQFFGLEARWHHLVNLLFHVASSVLLFLVFQHMTGATWRSAFVAGLFALHPLHVESVAWIAERKDVLSTFFLILTIGAYSRYAKAADRKWTWYGLSLACFTFGLMSKPMLVSAPCLLVLLDIWPLRRLQFMVPSTSIESKAARKGQGGRTAPTIGRLIREKIPFFAMAAASCMVTVFAQHRGNAISTVSHLPLDFRFANAIASGWTYLAKTVLPTSLAVFYPHPATSSSQWDDWQVALGTLSLIVVSAFVLRSIKRFPWLTLGWFWYLITLLPVIGIIQVGSQGMADRYTYVPLIGIFICFVWMGAELLMKQRIAKGFLTGAALLILVSCAIAARRQVSYWQNDFTLFGRALEVTSNNAVAHSIFAQELAVQGKYEQAIEHFQAAIQADPGYVDAKYNFALVLDKHAFALAQQGQLEDAAREYRASLQVIPTSSAHNSLGAILSRLGRNDEALNEYSQALAMDPNLADARYNMGIALAVGGKVEDAVGQFNEVIRLKPSHLEARARLAELLTIQGKLDEAAAQLEEILRQQPTAQVWHRLGVTRAMQGKGRDAAASFRQAIALDPNQVSALNDLAWLLATAGDIELRDGGAAVKLAEHACQLTDFRETVCIGTLAAAYAEAGRFPDAIKTAERAVDLAMAAGKTELAGKNRELLELYRSGKPYHER